MCTNEQGACVQWVQGQCVRCTRRVLVQCRIVHACKYPTHTPCTLYTCTHTPLVHNYSSHIPLECTHPVHLYSCIHTDRRYYPIIVHYCGCKHACSCSMTIMAAQAEFLICTCMWVTWLKRYICTHASTLTLYTHSPCTHHPYFLVHTPPLVHIIPTSLYTLLHAHLF